MRGAKDLKVAGPDVDPGSTTQKLCDLEQVGNSASLDFSSSSPAREEEQCPPSQGYGGTSHFRFK